MPTKFILSLKQGISLNECADSEQISLKLNAQTCIFNKAQNGFKLALQKMISGGAEIEHLNQLIQRNDGNLAVLNFYLCLQKLSHYKWLCHSVYAGDQVIAIATPICQDAPMPCSEIKVESKYQLSRFAYFHQVDGQLTLESPLSKYQVLFISWEGTALMGYLSQPLSYNELVQKFPEIDNKNVKQLMNLLLSLKILTEVDDNNNSQESNQTLAQWEFHDLLFHTRSRIGRHQNRSGGTYRFLDKITPLSALKPKMSNKSIKLYKPNLEKLKLNESSLTKVLEQRRSIREYDTNSITIEELGEFLYRCARVKRSISSKHYEGSQRPYPSGGGIYELELYPIISDCHNAAKGLYHYQPLAHELCLIRQETNSIERLLNYYKLSFRSQNLQVIIVIAARFQRLAWKYESISYALMLKNLGALYQTMYLVATAMRLAPCALGSGNSDIFSNLLECDYFAETSVGEFALGSRSMIAL